MKNVPNFSDESRSLTLKLGIARRQLGTALCLFIDDKDPVSVHCLACSAGEISYHLAMAAGHEPAFSAYIGTGGSNAAKEVWKMRNDFWNSMKHMRNLSGQLRDDEFLIEQFDDSANDAVLFLGWFDLAQAAGIIPLEAFVFSVWFLSYHQQKWPYLTDSDTVQSHIHLLFPEMPSDRVSAKRLLKRKIDWIKSRPSITIKERVEHRPLILGNKSHPLRHDVWPYSKIGIQTEH